MDMDANAALVMPCQRLNCALLACGVSSLLIAAGTLAVTLTVYRVRAPVMTMNAISLLTDPAATSSSSSVLTVVADVSVRNPNAASLRYGHTETTVFYRGRPVGRAAGPPGTAPARRTVRMNVTVGVAVGELLVVGQPAGLFLRDVAAGAVEVATRTAVRGRVAVLGGAVRRRVALEMNCTATVAVADMSIREQSCRQRVWLQ
ncbi:hypothetical protein PR202_ga07120 [Eleusine coracana subsp. coracana]|uniref:Late embryogenesis abundant protein LEA-2 subgroup domain-containing protein n=1 Tax=Eleusine coracana subsp. coracana TaxID=191504 RepID=A0AAV5BYD7_ELECO|nr:hypothetical protein QOZ80_2AG0108540 [Eleusine coracana subsp. coracana]GJM90805.1 hypothetical protein PR202_ga07120 [Eleusine coracana subsp. coracana]